MNDGWIDLWDEEDYLDEKELLIEFEKLINGEKNEYDELAKDKSFYSRPDNCRHVWISTGRSPILDTPWFNCKNCGMKKEVYDKSRERD